MAEHELPAYDGSIPIDLWKLRRAKELKHLRAQESNLLRVKDADGKPLYRLTSGSNIVRVHPLPKALRKAAVERDGKCLECGGGAPFEVDHIIRYVDGGPNELSNLQTLCVPCHKRKGGR